MTVSAVLYITQETAICYNPLINNFTGDGKNLTDP